MEGVGWWRGGGGYLPVSPSSRPVVGETDPVAQNVLRVVHSVPSTTIGTAWRDELILFIRGVLFR